MAQRFSPKHPTYGVPKTGSYNGANNPQAIKTEYTGIEGEILVQNGRVQRQPSFARRFGRKINYLIYDTWLPETVSWLFAFGCLVAVIAILWRFDKNALPDFPYGITVGTLVALFTTLAATALMVPVSQGISQLKWLHFASGEKRVLDLEAFDQASRGVWGSIILIFSSLHGKASSLGSLLTIFVIAVNAITQQSIRYKLYQVPDNNGVATTPISTYFNSYSRAVVTLGQALAQGTDRETHGAILSGLFHGLGSEVPIKSPRCSTGNCTWANYKTLAVCSSVVDVSESLKTYTYTDRSTSLHEKRLAVELPNVAKFNVSTSQDAIWVLRPTGFVPDPIASYFPIAKSMNFAALENSTAAGFYVVWNAFLVPYEMSSARTNAVEVNLHFCVQTLNTTVVNGVAATYPIGDPVTAFDYSNPTVYMNYPSQNVTAVLPDTTEHFIFNSTSQHGLRTTTSLDFNGTWISQLGLESFNQQGAAGIALRPVVDLLIRVLPGVTGGGWVWRDADYMETFSRFARNIATSISNRMRSSDNTGIFQGVPMTSQTKIQVSWPWISLLVALVVGSFVFLVSVARMNHAQKTRLWRSSNVALVQAIDPSARAAAMHGMYDNTLMLENAAHTYLTLGNEDGVWKLVD